MFITEMFSEKQIKVIYPGRFQPAHKGHAQVYQYLCKKFGEDNVYIVTSDKVDPPKSPFNFAEKAKMWALTGVNTDRVVMDSQPYRAPKLVAQWDPASTILLFAISEKDMAEDPRFQFGPKKDGSPSYFQKFTNLKNCETLDKHGYMMTVPTFDFTVLGKPANSASQIRAQFAGADLATQKKIVTDLFGKFDNSVFKIMQSKLESAVTEDIMWEDDDSDIAAGLVAGGRTHDEAMRIIRAARRRAALLSKKVGGLISEPAWGNTIAHQISAEPRGQEKFVKGESVEESGYAEKKYGVKYKIFAGREGRLTTKEAWFKSSAALERGVARIEALDGFYEIDGYSYPHGEEQGVEESRATNKPPKKGSQKWLTAQKRKEYDKKNPPIEPDDNMVGTAKVLPKKNTVAESELQWNDFPDLSINSKIDMFESYYATSKHDLFESNEQSGVEKFKSLYSLAAKPVIGASYIVSLLGLVNNEVMELQTPLNGVLVDYVDNVFSIKTENGIVTFPSDNMRDKILLNTFLFTDSKDYTKFRSYVSLSFSNPLSDAKESAGNIGDTTKVLPKSQVTELSPATHDSHVEKRSPQIIPMLMKDVKKGARMARSVSTSMKKGTRPTPQDPDEPNIFTEETNSEEMRRLKRELAKSTDPNKKEAIKLNIRKLKGEIELRARNKVNEDSNDLLNPDPKIRALATAVVKMKKELHDLNGGGELDESSLTELHPDTLSSYMDKVSDDSQKPYGDPTKRSPEKANKSVKGFSKAFTKRYIPKDSKTESIVPGFGEMRPEQVKKEVEGLTAEMLKYARDGNMRAVAEYIKKLQPFVDTARKGEITESIDKALRTAKRNAI